MAKFKIGDTVVVKKGVKDPDFDADLGGLYGRITAFNPGDNTYVEISWDSITLKNLSPDLIASCTIENLDFTSIILKTDEIELGQPRDTIKETQKTITEMTAQQMLRDHENKEDGDLAVDFFAPIAAHLAAEDMEWDADEDYAEEDVFNIEDFFVLLGIPKNEQKLVEKCLAKGLYNYYMDIYSYEKYGNNLTWLIEDRMYEPFIFGYGTTEIIKNKKITSETKNKIIAYTLSITTPDREYGIPHGLIHILHYLAIEELLDTGTFNLIMITLQTNPHTTFDDFPLAGWKDLSKWIINSSEISADETVWWIWQFSTKFAKSLNYPQGSKIVEFWMNHPGISSEAKLELCWAWLTDSKDVGSKPIAWQLMDAQMTGDVKTVRKLLKGLGVPPADIAGAIRNMEFIQSEIADPILNMSFMSSFADFVWLPSWLKRLAVPFLVQLGEDPLDICVILLDQSRDYMSEGINKGVADVLGLYGNQLPPDELRALIEKGLKIPQVGTRKAFYQVSTQFYGNKYMQNTQTDNAASIRKWGKKKLES